MLGRRAFIALAVPAGLLVSVALPARAASTLVQSRGFSGVSGRSGSALRYADRSDGQVFNSVTLIADDVDGSGGRCTETWVDYSTKPHLHFNPAVLVNCSGGERSASGVLANDKDNVRSMSVIVCEVPDTPSSPITRNRKNCRGQLGTMHLHSGEKYEDFAVSAARSPNGIQFWRA